MDDDDTYFTVTRGLPSRGDDGVVRLRLTLSGEFDLGARDPLHDALREVTGAGGFDLLILDLAGVTFIDSEAIGAIVGGLDAARQAGVRTSLVHASGIVARVLDILGIDDMTDGADPR